MSAPDLLAAAILFVIAFHAISARTVRRPMDSISPVSFHAKPAARQRARIPDNGSHRTGGRIATIVTVAVLVLLVPAKGAPPYAGPPMLVADPATANGATVVSISGRGFEDHLQGELALDGDTAGMPSFRVRGNGTFTERLTFASNIESGPHVVSALAPEVVASVIITIAEANSPSPTPSPSPTTSPPLSPSPTAPPTPSPSPTAPPTPSPSPTTSPTPSPSPTASVDHVFVVVMENRAESQVWGTSETPYTTAFAQANARAADYYAITHPSLPNYLDLYAGSNYGITTNCNPSTSCHINALNLADNLETAGHSWRGYFESMPAPCYTSDFGDYVAHHNPFIYFDDIRTNTVRCAEHVVDYSVFSVDLATVATTPDFAFIVPNNCNNTHDCPIGIGDTWLSNNLPPILNSPACTIQSCLLILTWDEDNGSEGNHVLTVFGGSAARSGYVSNATYDHFDLLRTMEDLLGVPTQTSNDTGATSMSDMLEPSP
ncbi:MAG: alkaline phosphatase family protein [Nocardioidaceae bacterium]